MRVLITGAYGLIGSYCLARLQCDRHELVGTGRDISNAVRKFPFAHWIAADFDKLTNAADWQPLLKGIDAVVNCVGVLQDGLRDNTHRVHVDATCALFDACAAAGVRRIVHVSAIGATGQGSTTFARTKAEADAHLQTLDFHWVILRPALVLATGVYGGSAMLRAISVSPGAVPLIGADCKVQVVDIDDVTETVARCLAPNGPSKTFFDLAHPQVHTLAQVVMAQRGWLGFAPRPVLPLSGYVQKIVSLVADGIGLLGWRSPARSTAFAQLTAGVVGDPSGWMMATGIKPKSLTEIFQQRVATVQDRWFAKLYLLKPLAIVGIAAFWFVTGVITLGPGRASATAQLGASGFAPTLVEIIVLLGAWFDIMLGLVLLIRRLAKPTLIVMLAATMGYLLIGTILAPQLWADPLGPLLKIVPTLVAMALTLAILDER